MTPPTLLLDVNVRFDSDTDRAIQIIDAVAEVARKAAVPVVLKGEILWDAKMALPLDDYTERYWTRGANGEWMEGAEPFHQVVARKTMPLDKWRDIYQYAIAAGLPLVLSAYDWPGYTVATALALEADMGALKVASSNSTHWPLVRSVFRRCADHGLDCYLDTGGATIGDVEKAYRLWREAIRAAARDGGGPTFSSLHVAHSPPGHPAPPENMHIRRLETLRLLCPAASIGLSHHGETLAPIIAAVARGAEFVEIAVCDRPNDLDQDVAISVPLDTACEVAQAMADAAKCIGHPCMVDTITSPMQGSNASMGLVAAKDLASGDRVELKNVEFAFPNADHHRDGGIPVKHWDDVEGMSLRRSVAAGEPIQWEGLGRTAADVDGEEK